MDFDQNKQSGMQSDEQNNQIPHQVPPVLKSPTAGDMDININEASDPNNNNYNNSNYNYDQSNTYNNNQNQSNYNCYDQSSNYNNNYNQNNTGIYNNYEQNSNSNYNNYNQNNNGNYNNYSQSNNSNYNNYNQNNNSNYNNYNQNNNINYNNYNPTNNGYNNSNYNSYSQNNNEYNNYNPNNNGYNNNRPYYNRNAYNNAEPGGSFATAAMVLGIVSIVTSFTFTVYPPFIVGSIAIILAILSKGQRPNLLSKARTGVICAVIGLVMNTVIVITSMVLLFTNPYVRAEVNKTFEKQYGMSFDEMWEEMMEDNGF